MKVNDKVHGGQSQFEEMSLLFGHTAVYWALSSLIKATPEAEAEPVPPMSE